MSLSEYFIDADAQTTSLQIRFDNVSVTFRTTEVAVENDLDYLLPT